MANITLFAQGIRLTPREIIQRLVKKHGTDKHAKGFNSWSHLVTMIFSPFSGSVSLRQISEGRQSATGNLKHLGLSRAPSQSNISYQNANRTSLFFEDVFYALFQYLGQQRGCFHRQRKRQHPIWVNKGERFAWYDISRDTERWRGETDRCRDSEQVP